MRGRYARRFPHEGPNPMSPKPVKPVHVRVLDIYPCPENESIYAAHSLDDPDIVDLINSIRENGVLEPLQVSIDNMIISGHRRWFCARMAGLETVPVRRSALSYENGREAFLKLLVEANTQRKKTPGMLLREVVMKID